MIDIGTSVCNFFSVVVRTLIIRRRIKELMMRSMTYPLEIQ